MTVSEYAIKEEQCKQATLGKVIGNNQCWDLVQYYVTNYLGVPEWVLAGCGYVNNLLYPPKINDVLQYFDEVPTNQMIKGDIMIWEIGHIAIFDNFDGANCWYLTQNDGTGENPHGATRIGILNLGSGRAFRLKGITPNKKIKLRGHIQDIGWSKWQDNVCGTTGEGKRLEAIQIDAPEYEIYVKAHIETLGWVDYGKINKKTIIGTTGENKRIEAIQIIANGLTYQVHTQDLGWSSIVPTEEKYSLGTAGYSKRIEALVIK